MSDPTPEDLYDALRKRLADYGQEPPPELWAGIRQQLPPPVAAAPLRRRKRRAAWLLALLVVSVGSWQLWRSARPEGAAGTETAVWSPSMKPSHSPASTSSVADSPRSAAKSTGTTDAAAAPRARREAGKPETTSALPTTPPAAKSIATTTVPTGHDRKSALVGSSPAAAVGPIAAISSRAKARHTAGQGRLIGSSAYQTTELSAPGRGRAGRRRPTETAAAMGAPGSPGAVGVASAAAASVSGTAHTEAPPRRPTPAVPTRARNTTSSAAASGSQQPQPEGQLPNADDAPTAVAASPATEATGRAPLANSLANPASAPALPAAVSFADWSRLQYRAVGLNRLPTTALPAPLPADTLARPLVPAAARWAVQLLGGPSATYRRLGATGLSYAIPGTPPTNTSATLYSASGDATTTTQQERATTGFGAQVQVRRVLNGRWALGVGVGYHEYATRLDFQVVRLVAATLPPVIPANTPRAPSTTSTSTTTAYHLRNTYRFVTLPVHLSYQLGTGKRFRLSLVGGGDVAWYVGGTTAEASGCGCEPRSYGPTGSPYRSLSLALTLGAELRYRVAPRWELLAQPTATFFLTSLARPVSGLPPRYPLGTSAQAGLSYQLR